MSGFWQRTKSVKQTKREDYGMNKTTKILLTLSLTAFLTSLTGVLWGFFLPIGAVCLGLFMIFNLLGKEAESFDQEQRMRVAKATANTWTPQPSRWPQSTVSIAATFTR
jgi:hypothetical protein